MKPASPAAVAVERQRAARQRRGRPAISPLTGILLLAGLLLVAGIPVFATVRILDKYALVNERDRADSALRVHVRGAAERLSGLGDDASDRAADLSRSPALQLAFLRGDRAGIVRLARREPGVVFYLHGRRIAGKQPPVALTRSVTLNLDGQPVGTVTATVALDSGLATRLLNEALHARSDRLLFVQRNVVVGTGRRVTVDGRTARLAGERYRALLTRVPDAAGVGLLALRPEKAIAASVEPYQQRVLYAAIGSFALLVLVGLLFVRPILRTLGEFRRVASQAATDALTGLPNRRSFEEELVLEWRRAERIDASLGLILADIDDFKGINDRFGHQAGDDVLRKVGEVFASRVRQVDLAARYGGEEFAVIVPETDLEGAVRLAERLRMDLIEAPVELPDTSELRVTASFGVAVKDRRTRAEELVAAADDALYEAKRTGKNRVAHEPVLAAETKPAVPPLERRRRSAAKPEPAKQPANAATKTPPKTPAKTPARKPAKWTATRRKTVGKRQA